MSSLITKSKVKRLALDLAADTRRLADGSPRFTRVSRDFLEHIEAQVRVLVTAKVHSLPSLGRTIMP